MPAHPHPRQRPPLWAGLLLAGLLLLAQGWGLWHRVAHGAGAAHVALGLQGPAEQTSRSPGAEPAGGAADAWFGHAAGAHGGLDCLWFDHLACGDGVPAGVALLATTDVLPQAALPPAAAAPSAGPRAAFQARAPPRAGA